MNFHWSNQGNFKPQIEIPEKGNPYYNRKASGGYSNAIEGRPVQDGLDVLSNCVGYAYGRYNELWGDKTMPYLQPIDARYWYDRSASWGLNTSEEPVPGAVMCFGYNAGTLPNGHVCIVEKITERNKDGTAKTIITSNSYYGSDAFMLKTYYRNAQGVEWWTDIPHAIISTFQGFILPPSGKGAKNKITTTPNGRYYGG